MEHTVGICDLTGQTHTECVAYEGMIDGCQVILTADWCLSEVRCSTVVQKWNFTGRLFERTVRASPTAEHHQHPQIESCLYSFTLPFATS